MEGLRLAQTLDDTYYLEEQVGEGAMGVVYLATDLQRRRPVAIKVMKGSAASNERLRRLFRREARAMARLDHPGIIQIYGYGVATGDRPYLAMEWVSGASLLHLDPPDTLEGVVALVDRVLEALAHAHARGVIHRDLKPANILVPEAGAQDLHARGAVKLVDFGIARVFEEPTVLPQPGRSFAEVARRGLNPETRPHEVRLEGTPRYMAPELYRGRDGLICPANDIYAVGVLLFELLTGCHLYEEAGDELALMGMQLKGELPEVRLRPCLGPMEIPYNLLRQMLAADPLQRTGHAAEARRDLRRWFNRQRQRGNISSGAVLASQPRRNPQSWRSEDPMLETHAAPSQAVAQAEPELNLLVWRPMPVLGRAAEQSRLWHLGEQAVARRQATICFLEGEPGVGKSHLARWMAEASAEGQSFDPIWCNLHVGNTLEALREGLSRYLLLSGVEPNDVPRRLSSVLRARGLPPGHVDEERFLDFLQPRQGSRDLSDTQKTSTFTGSFLSLVFEMGEELAAQLARLLEVTSDRCPPLLVFDGMEAHHADSVLRLMEHIVRQQRARSFPVMFVVTAVRGVLEQASGLARESLAYLQVGALTKRMVLQPLDNSDLSQILDRFQSFDATTRDVILRRAQGNPLYAVELASHALRQPGSQAMPGSIAELWRRRVALIALRSRRGESALRVLELAAVLGAPIWLDLLYTAWSAPALEPLRQEHRHEEILGTWELWIEHGVLLEEQGGRVVFRHALLRETLISDMRGDQRYAWMHLAAAWAQRQLDLAQTPQDWHRLAQHLMYGQALEEAWPFAHGAAVQLGQQGQLREAQAAWLLCEQILMRQGIPEHDERRTLVEVGAAQLAWRMGDPEEFRRRACLLCDWGRRTGQLGQLGLGELLLAELSLHDAAPQAAEELFGRALSRFETCGDDRGQCEARLGMARLALRSGRAQVAQRQVALATSVLARLKDRAALGRARLLGGQCLCARGLLEPAEEILHQALQDFEAVGERLGVARALGELGQLAQAREDHHRAEELFSHYLQQAEALGDIPSMAQARANLGQARLKLDKLDSAVRLLEQAWAVTADLNDRSSSTIIQCILALALARQGNWTRSRSVLHSALESLRQLQLFDLDVAESLERIVLLPGARKKLQKDFLLILGQARSQWRNLGYEDRSHHLARLASRM